ncbi:unnamed protein product [Prorocentrum cordatum]|uniref:Uncharacterized protein n=1 Tax=Prorocentrum cordatum TaxID=2364126 RepID=A0ABN9SG39_9DINO|nr:unnamed protein product [Polarella glacialis]
MALPVAALAGAVAMLVASVAVVMMAIRFLLATCCLAAARTLSQARYLVDNRELNAQNPGIACRASKNMSDRMDEEVLWGNVVTGVDEGDGWLRLMERYLPMVLDGQPALVPAANGPDLEDGRDREYIVDNTSCDSQEAGLYFCRRKDLSDRMPEMVRWGELVMGVDQGDGWLYMKPRFLPMRLQGVTVLSPFEENAQ